uniref:Uncharacterized protein n=1 Tax=Anguilla anguilla TaxID=7936 RepID=A0A0E9VR57_ANGAN
MFPCSSILWERPSSSLIAPSRSIEYVGLSLNMADLNRFSGSGEDQADKNG